MKVRFSESFLASYTDKSKRKNAKIYMSLLLRNHRLQVFTPEGEFVSKIGREGTKVGQLKIPDDVAVSKNGRVYVTDYLNFRVQILY